MKNAISFVGMCVVLGAIFFAAFAAGIFTMISISDFIGYHGFWNCLLVPVGMAAGFAVAYPIMLGIERLKKY